MVYSLAPRSAGYFFNLSGSDFHSTGSRSKTEILQCVVRVAVLVLDWTVAISFSGNLQSFVPIATEETLAELATVWRQNESGFSASQLV
jgi:hypothetical protein